MERGPYRYLRHPNYVIVIAEIAVVPLAFGAIALALVFSAVNLALILRRVRVEDRALAELTTGLPGFMSSGRRRSAD